MLHCSTLVYKLSDGCLQCFDDVAFFVLRYFLILRGDMDATTSTHRFELIFLRVTLLILKIVIYLSHFYMTNLIFQLSTILVHANKVKHFLNVPAISHHRHPISLGSLRPFILRLLLPKIDMPFKNILQSQLDFSFNFFVLVLRLLNKFIYKEDHIFVFDLKFIQH